MKYTVNEKEKTIKIHTNVSAEKLKTLLENYKGYTVIFEDEEPKIQMITDSGFNPCNYQTETNPYDIQYTYQMPKGSADTSCCGNNCECKNNNENKK